MEVGDRVRILAEYIDVEMASLGISPSLIGEVREIKGDEAGVQFPNLYLCIPVNQLAKPVEVCSLVIVSTYHVTMADDYLYRLQRGVLNVDEEPPEEASASLLALIYWAREMGYDYIKLDQDGQVVDELPIEEWT